MLRYLSFILLSVISLQIMRADDYYDRKVSQFELLPVTADDIVFLGNSITDGGEFNELFDMPNIKNRGIRSDVITGVEKRIGQVTAGEPAKIFLLIGINDISHNLSVEEMARRYDRLVNKIKQQSPRTQLYLQSVMPINNSFGRYKNLAGKEETIVLLNEKIKEIADRYNSTYIDLHQALADESGHLNPAFTNDGLHLMGRGYRVWTGVLLPYIKNK